jgi:DNA-binding transcriptional regulator GbsR (MarR family)
MEESVQHFIERMGLICEGEGMARSAGRIFALLLLSDRACSLDELADELQVSKASVSTNARMLESLGFIERVSSLGDRRDFYQADHDPWERMLRVAQERWADMVAVFAEAQERLPAERAVARTRMRDAEQFHRLLLVGSEKLIEEWRSLREKVAPAADLDFA